MVERKCRLMRRMLPDCLADIARAKPDLLVCGGDLIDHFNQPGWRDDLEAVHDIFEQSGLAYQVIPGNHDPQPETFYEVFHRPPREMRFDACRLIFFCDDSCVNRDPDSVRSKDSIDRMTQLLKQATPGISLTLLIQHYVIYPNCNDGYPHNYRNAAAIRNIMEDGYDNLISISGHYHPGVDLTAQGGVRYFIGRAFCEAPHPYYLLHINDTDIKIEQRGMLQEV